MISIGCTVSYKKIRTAIFFCFGPPIHISGNCLALDLNSGGKKQSEWWELGRMKKGVIGSISPWPCLHPTPKKYEQNQTGCLEFSWREKMNNELFPQFLGFLVTCPKIDNEPKAIPDITFFPFFLSSLLRFVPSPLNLCKKAKHSFPIYG
jgi:hypothetical protein